MLSHRGDERRGEEEEEGGEGEGVMGRLKDGGRGGGVVPETT